MTADSLASNVYELFNPVLNKTVYLNVFTGNEGIGIVDYPDFGKEFRNSSVANLGQHGIFSHLALYGARSLQFSVKAVADTPAQIQSIIDDLMEVINLPAQPTTSNTGQIRIRWTDVNSESWEIYARLFAEPVEKRDPQLPTVASFLLQFKADDPIIYSQTKYTATGNMGWLQGGLEIPVTVPTEIPLAYPYALEPFNSGNFNTYAKITVQGYASKPTILNITTGKKIVLDYPIATNESIIFNSKDGTIVNQDGVDLTGYMEIGSSFVNLAVGQNLILYYDSDDLYNPYLTGQSNRISPIVDDQNITIEWQKGVL